MPSTVIVGLEWGDEGKGKIIDHYSKDADLVVRYNGGDNAGHTVYVGNEKFVVHVLPSGVVRGKKAAIGCGVALNPDVLRGEINYIQSKGRKVDLVIDERTHVITPEHIEEDLAKSKEKLGTTGKGIGPCYKSRVERKGVRMFEYAKTHPEFQSFIGDVSALVNDYIDSGRNVLLEGAQGALLDVNYGTYPFVTSSEVTSGGACTGIGLSPKKIGKVIGVAKSYPTRVGRGPFPTELGTDEQTMKESSEEQLTTEDVVRANKGEPYYLGKYLRKKGAEYGSTTGRARRTGWFDSLATRHACRINGVDEIALTKLDVLGGLHTLKICLAYEKDGGNAPNFPVDLEGWKPYYIPLKGWKEDISNLRSFDDFPKEAKSYVGTIEASLGTPITVIGVGPERDQIVLRKI